MKSYALVTEYDATTGKIRSSELIEDDEVESKMRDYATRICGDFSMKRNAEQYPSEAWVDVELQPIGGACVMHAQYGFIFQ
jgi:hypothetical protein